MAYEFQMIPDTRGQNTFGLYPLDKGTRTTLSVGVAQTFTVPVNEGPLANWGALFTYEPGATVWVAFNDTATLPSGSPAATVCEMNPAMRYVKPGDTISLITPNTTAEVGVAYRALP
jgi:hypothetical protein